MQKSYSKTSFALNWCQTNWHELFYLQNHATHKECYARYKDPNGENMHYNDLFKFLVHYIAAVPEINDMKYEMDDCPTFEIVIESLAQEVIEQLLFECDLIVKTKNDLYIDETTFVTRIILQIGTAKLVHKRRNTICNPHVHGQMFDAKAMNRKRRNSVKSRQERLTTFYRKIKSSNGKSSERGGGDAAITHDDIVSYRQVFGDILILYPVGQMLRRYRSRIRKTIIRTMRLDSTKRSDKSSITSSIIEWIRPALHAHKIPPQSETAHKIAAQLTLLQLKDKAVVFLAGDEAKYFYILLQGSIAVFDGTLHEGNHVITLQSGSGFGGLALAADEPQNNSCLCSSDCLIGTLTKSDYSALMQPAFEMNPRQKYATLSRCQLLKWTPQHLLKELSLYAVTRFFDRNSLITQQGDLYEDGVYFIKEGSVRTVRELPSGVFVNVHTLGQSESFGWECLLTAFPSFSSTITNSKVVLYQIQKSHLLHKLDHKSLQHIYNNLGNFPSDLELADQLVLSQKWNKYRNNIFSEVKTSRDLRTKLIKDHDKGALTASLQYKKFPFSVGEKLDVAIEPKEIDQHLWSPPKTKKWGAVKAIFNTTNIVKTLDRTVDHIHSNQNTKRFDKMGKVQKSKFSPRSPASPQSPGLKVEIYPKPHNLGGIGDYNKEESNLKRPSTPRSYKIITQRNKHRYDYYQYRKKASLLKLPGYSWLNSDQQKSVKKAYVNRREQWLIQSNKEEEESQAKQRLLFKKIKKARAEREKHFQNMNIEMKTSKTKAANSTIKFTKLKMDPISEERPNRTPSPPQVRKRRSRSVSVLHHLN